MLTLLCQAFISIFSAVLITMIGVGIERPDTMIQATVHTEFASAFQSLTNIIFAYAGHVAFFSFISELKDPNDFPKALFFLQAWDISLYIIAAIVIYRYAGTSVASPALGSTATVVKKVAYGIALPTVSHSFVFHGRKVIPRIGFSKLTYQIIIAGVIYCHVAAKYIYVRIFRGTKHMSKRTWLSVGSWIGIISILWILGWIIAESIPVFNDLLSLISSLFASWFTYGLSGQLAPVVRSVLSFLNILIESNRCILALSQLRAMVQKLEKDNIDHGQFRDFCPRSSDLWYRAVCQRLGYQSGLWERTELDVCG